MSENPYDDIKDAWHSRGSDPNEFRDPIEYWCTSCGTSGLFLWDDASLDAHGFTTSEAPHGICVGCARLDERSGETIDERVQDPEYFSIDIDGKTTGTILKHRGLTEEELEEEKMRTPFSGRGQDKNARYKIKSLYRSAIGNDIYYKFNPPYFVGNRKELMLGNDNRKKEEFGKDKAKAEQLIKKEVNTNKKKSETDVEKYTFIDTHNDWFLCLYESFKIHEDYLKKFTSSSKKPRPRRGGYALLATYLHKSHEWNNIEPIWYYLKRMGFADIQMKRRMDSWINPLPPYHLTQVNCLASLDPNANTIDNLISLLGRSENLALSQDEIVALRTQSKNALKKLDNYQIEDGLSFLQYLHSRCKFGEGFSLSGHEIHAAGMIEALCIRYSALNILSETKGNVVSKTLFPGNHAGWWWKKDLAKEAMHVFEDFNNYFNHL